MLKTKSEGDEVFQTTIRFPVSCYGIGVHSGKTVQLTLKPAKANQGIVFVRTDIPGTENYIFADYSNVTDTSLCTKIARNNLFSISTIEHLMAAIWGSNIDNVIIEIDGEEVPIMDGSSKPFVFMIDCAQMKQLNTKRKYLKLNKEIVVSSPYGGVNIATPSQNFKITMDIDFESKAIGKQSFIYDDRSSFNKEIANARTFGFVHELEYLRSKGLAKGASLNNAIGIDKDVILNHEGLRHKDEFVKHKLLDAVGDFSLASLTTVASFNCTKTGHTLNNLLLRMIFDNQANYSWLSHDELQAL